MEKVFIKDKQDNKVLPITHVSAVLDDNGNDIGSVMGAFEDEVRGLVDTPHQEYVTVATYASLPASGSKDTIYRVSNYNGSTSQVDTTSYSEYAWDGSQYIFLCVKSQIDDVFDITVYNNNTKYADLSAALGVDGANIPATLRRGGMSVKFVQSSDNKYVQYRLMSDTFNTTPANWQGVDDEPTAGSQNLPMSGGVQRFVQTEVGLNFEQTYPIPETTSIYPLPFNLKSGETIHIYCAVLSRYSTKLRNNSTELIRMGSVMWYVYTATDDFNNLNLEIDSRNDQGDLHFLMISGAFWDIINKVAKIDTPIEGNFPVISSTGEIANSNYNPNSFQPKDTTILKQADIVNNLNSDDSTKVLSAAQGKILHEIEKEIMIDNSKEIAAITTNYMWNRATSSTDDPNPTDYDAKPRIGSNITFALANNTIFPYIGNFAQFTFGATGNIFIYQLIELDGSVDISSKRYKIGFEVEVDGHITDARIFLGDDNHKITTGLNIEDSATTWQSTFNGSDVVARNGKYYIWLRLWAAENSVVKIGRFTVIELQPNEDVKLPYPALRLDTQYKEELKNFFVDANAVKFVEQVLTDGQKQQARENIGITHNVADTSPYTGKKFYSVGDSITYQNLWQPTLAALMMMNYQSAATRDADYPLGIGGAAICPIVTLRTTNQGDDYKAVDNLGNQLVDGNNNPLWFEVGKAPKQSIYYRADYFNSQYDDAEVIVMHAGQNDSNRSEAGDERRTFLEIGTVSDTPYTGLQYVLPQFAQVALYYPNVAIYDPDGTIAQDPTYSGCTFISARPTFCACLAGVIKKICSACPEARFAIDSIMRYKGIPGIEDDSMRIAVYNAMKSVCQIYDIPFVDLWNEMGYNYYNFEVYHKPNDGVHPNETGGRRMAAVIAQKL